MKYRNASECLPAHLLRELQKTAPGQLLYVPALGRKAWGSGTGAAAFFSGRNAEIRRQYHSREADIPSLCDSYSLSDESVRKIIYQGGRKMDAGNTGKYFWQDDLVRLRRSRPDDWKLNAGGIQDSQERFFTDGEQELPIDDSNWPQIWENYVRANESGTGWVLLAVETLDGTYVGGGNIHGINERNGTFGIFVHCTEQRYAVAAARIMLDYAFNERRLHKCSDTAVAGDEKTIAFFEALGFVKEGVLRGEVFHQGKWWDEIRYGLFAEEFNAQRNP